MSTITQFCASKTTKLHLFFVDNKKFAHKSSILSSITQARCEVHRESEAAKKSFLHNKQLQCPPFVADENKKGAH